MLRISGSQVLAIALLIGASTAGVFADTSESFTEPDKSHKVAAPEIGTVQRVHVKKGQRVEAGELLVTLDTSVLNASLEVAKAKAEGTARLESVEAELAIRKKRLDKMLLLKEQGAGSSEEVDRATADVRVAESNVAAAKEERHLNQLDMKRISAQIERNKVRSPITGFITKLDKKVSEFVSQNEPNVATVVNIDQLRARFHVTTLLARQLSKGSQTALSIPALRKDRRAQLVTAIVDFVSPITDPDSGTVHIEVVFANPKHEIQSGVRCKLLADRIPLQVVTKPQTAIRKN